MAALVVIAWMAEARRHRRLIAGIPVRIHVNGIRGKSTVVRYIAGAFREAGIETIAKTTGSAARLIDEPGEDKPLDRPAAPTILEQIEVLRRYARPTTEAVVVECMALNPDYQDASEHQIVRSTTGVIVNVRRDHIDQLGETVPEIARSLCRTMPRNARMVTAERQPEALAVIRDAAERARTALDVVDRDSLDDVDMQAFGPFAFRDNIALALAVARHHGIDRDVALRGIASAKDDPGASRLHEHEVEGKRLIWVNLFGVNDPESMDGNLERVVEWLNLDPSVFILLNNRADRDDRTADFANHLARNVTCDGIVVIGELADKVRGQLVDGGVDADRVMTPRVDSVADVDELLTSVAGAADGEVVLLVGIANIHTEAADALIERLETHSDALSAEDVKEIDAEPATGAGGSTHGRS